MRPAVGMGLLWLAWSVGLYGYCLVRGYDVTLLQLIKPVVWNAPWPPGPASASEVIPSGAATANPPDNSFTDIAAAAVGVELAAPTLFQKRRQGGFQPGANVGTSTGPGLGGPVG